MTKRFVSIWFRHLATDWFALRAPELRAIPFVLRTSIHGRMMIAAANATAQRKGIEPGMVLADARAIMPDLQVEDDRPDLAQRLLTRLAEWCIRFTPIVAVDLPDGLLLDVTGCSHLWGGDAQYLEAVVKKIAARGYDIRAAMADTAGAAWGVARFGKDPMVIAEGKHIESLLSLPPESLRLEPDAVARLHKLGLHQVSQFIQMPRSSLRRRFGIPFLQRLDLAMGKVPETLVPVHPIVLYEERLPCMDPIVTAAGIAYALDHLLNALCYRLLQEQKGLRNAILKCYRVDGKTEQIQIGTHRATHSVHHLFKLFDLKIATIEPALGIELFVLEATGIEECIPQQEKIWEGSGGLEDVRLSELIDRLGGKLGMQAIHRYLPDEHYWPERSLRRASSLIEKLTMAWPATRLRPVQLLHTPERVEVTAPIPDYPPMLFRYKGKIHQVVKADGPERIEQEWWLQQGQHRDYYRVEDEAGQRYWLFRSGHYSDKSYQWFIHGFFA